jgi:hypothetical protein
MNIKYLEWNLHAMGGHGYEIPDFVAKYVTNVDIFVLVEFCASEGWVEFKTILEKEFDLYCSPFVSKGYNQVCIGLRKTLKYQLHSVVTKDICNVNIPEFLQIDIEIAAKKLSVIGVRIKTQGDTKSQQYEYLKGHLNKIERFICLGDFNCVQNILSEQFSSVDEKVKVYGPRIKNGYYSFVHKNGGKCGLDWLIAKGITNVSSEYDDKQDSPVATYDWSFVSEKNGYNDKSKDSFLGINGLPDHAILKGMVEI